MAATITAAIVLITKATYIFMNSDLVRAAHWPNRDSLKDWGPLIKLGTSSAMMLCAEFWCFEILLIFAGLMGVE